MDSVCGLRSSVRSVLALGSPARRRRAVGVLRLAALTALLWGLAAGPAAAQPPYRQELLRAFSSLDVGERSSPDFGDLDGDGDLDAVVGEWYGTLRYFANTGSSSAPAFVEQTGTANPLAAFDVGFRSAPTFVDVNSDGDLDVVAGEDSGTLRYYSNWGTSTAPAFSEKTGTANIFGGVDVGNRSAPEFADLDGDGDLDLVVGAENGSLKYFENVPQSFGPVYIERTGSANPFNGIDAGSDSAPSLADLDADGDLDAAIGERGGALGYFANTGSSTAAAFIERTDSANPFSGIDVGTYSAPDLVDLDGDGDLDAFFGWLGGAVKHFVNTGSATAPAFVEQTGTANPLSGIEVGVWSSPELADLDADGDLDVMVGTMDGILSYFANTGSSTAPAFAERTGTANPFDGFDVGNWSAPGLGDLDSDGDLDLVVGHGTWPGTLKYFANTGSSTAPAFVERIGSANPFDAIALKISTAPDLADLDGDGDLDAVVGLYDGTTRYLANTGPSTAPGFVEQTGSANPFAGLDVGYYSCPDLADLDRDGDLDAATGELYGTLPYFANSGSSSAPAFIRATGAANPFSGIDVGRNSHPELADLDGDGDLDLITGDLGGHLVFYRSGWLIADDFESGELAAGWTAGP